MSFWWIIMASWNWMLSTQKFVNQSSFDEGSLCDIPGVESLSYVNIFQDSRTQWSALRYADYDMLC